MSRVIVRTVPSYDYEPLKAHLFEMMEAFDGGRIVPGKHVVIKPNLLAPAAPDKAMLTHPMVLRAVAEYVISKGVRPQISDSSAMGTFEKVLKESGIKDALSGLDVELKEFKASVTIETGAPFHRIELAEDALNADLIINLPKLKTHCQMLLTLAVKNLFGCVVGLRKPEWHFRTGVDREKFAMLLVRIFERVNPAINILDGILAMEGQGPGKGGVPKQVGVLMASNDGLALDAAVCGMIGLEPKELLTIKSAEALGLTCSPAEIEGELPRIEGFKLPEITPLVFGPGFTHSLSRKHLVQRPVVSENLCKSCGECWRYCPAKAIQRKEKGLEFDYDRCIRCYCCLEVCPHGALKAELPLLGKIFSRLIRGKS
ncbi:MAG: DUF362 domain-containing protein [Acidobacteriota bacterium]